MHTPSYVYIVTVPWDIYTLIYLYIMERTRIWLKKETYKKLNDLKKELNQNSFDKVINYLINFIELNKELQKKVENYDKVVEMLEKTKNIAIKLVKNQPLNEEELEILNFWLEEELEEDVEEKTSNPDPNSNSEIILLVRCPHCGYEQTTTTIKRVKCWRCQRTYSVYPKKGTSRIVKIVKGTLEQLHALYFKTFKSEESE